MGKRQRSNSRENKVLKRKRQHQTKQETIDLIKKKMEFNERRRRCSEYNLLHMSPDGACGYRAMAQGLSFLTNKFTSIFLPDEIRTEIEHSIETERTERPKQWKKDERFINRLTTGDINSNRHLNRNQPTGRNKLSNELNVAEETAIARYIQSKTVDWLVKNQDNDFNGIEGYKIKELVCETHEYPNIETYHRFYKRFAGLPDHIMKKTDGFDKKGEPIFEKQDLPSRWCALPEQTAFCEMFKVHIDIYTPQEMRSSGKIVPASFRPSDKSRLHHVCSVGNPINPTITVLQTMNKAAAHYDYLIPKKSSQASMSK